MLLSTACQVGPAAGRRAPPTGRLGLQPASGLSAARVARAPQPSRSGAAAARLAPHHASLHNAETECKHRSERLMDLVTEFVHYSAKGALEGLSDQVMADLDGLVDNNLKVHMVGSPLRKGTAGLKEQLEHSHDYVGSMRPGKALYCASTEDDSVFCLLECQEVPGAEGGSPSDETHKAYAIAKFEILLDDTALRITDIYERFQLGPADAPLLAAHSPMHTSMRAALKDAGMSHFPSNIKEMEIDRDAAQASMAAWCKARCTGVDEANTLRAAVDEDSFKLWDGYNLLPLLCALDTEADVKPGRCINDFNSVLSLIKNMKAAYHMECQLVNSAVSTQHNIGFTHWRTKIRHEELGAEGAFVLEGKEAVIEAMEVVVFDASGKIVDIWMLRDPMPEERMMMMEARSKMDGVAVA